MGGICEERPRAALCQTQLVPADSNGPTAGTAEPLSQNGGTLENACLRKDKTQKQLCRCSAVRCGEPAVIKHRNR